MTFRPEPVHRHGSPARTAVVLVNLGTPDEPTAPALRRYLAEFLSDPRVVEIPRACVAAHPARHHPARAAGQVGRQVRVDLDARGLAAGGVDGAARLPLLGAELAQRGHAVEVRHAMRYGTPSIAQVMDELRAAAPPACWCCRLPAVRRRHHRQRGRCTAPLGAGRALGARTAQHRPVPRRPGLHRRAGRQRLQRTGSSSHRPNGWCSASTACPSAACTWATPTTASATRRAAAARAPGPAGRQGPRHLPEPLRQGQVAGALYRTHLARTGGAGREAAST
jgi:hypothetical protein